MAEKVEDSVDEHIYASICDGTENDPKLCRKCLVELVEKDQVGLTCPICCQGTPPANGTAGLQPSLRINRLLEIVEELKKAIIEPPASAESAERDPTSLTTTGLNRRKACCPEHAGKEVELYCKKCDEPICVKCVVTGAKHHGHDCEELNFESHMGEMTASLEQLEQQLSTTKKVLAQFERHCRKISNQRAAIEADIHERFRRLREMLDVRETEVIGQLHQLTQSKLKSLAVQRDQVEALLFRLGSCIGGLKERLETGSQEEVLMTNPAVFKQVKELATTISRDLLEPSKKADMVFSASADFVAACQNYGHVASPESPDPLRCFATGKGTEAAVVGETATALFHAIGFKGQPCEEPILSLESDLVSELSSIKTQCSVERIGQN